MLGLTKKKFKFHINRQQIFYFAALDIYLLEFLLSINARFGFWLDAIPKQYTLMSIAVIALLLLKMINDKYTKAELERVILFGVLFAIWIITAADYTYLPFLFMFIVASKNIDFRKVVLNFLVVHTLTFCLTVGGCLIGFISNFEKLGENGSIVKCLGYTSVVAPIMLYATTTFFVLYKKEGITLLQIVIILAVDYYAFWQCDLQMPFYMTIALLVIAYILKLTAKKASTLKENSMLGFVARNVFFFGAIVSFALSLMYNADSGVWSTVNSFLTNRLSLSQTAISTYGVGIFGQPITWSYVQDSSYLYPDSGYIQSAINYGIVYIVFLLVLFRYMGKYAIKSNNRYLLLALIMLSVYSVVNPSMFQLVFSPWLLMGGGLIYQQADSRIKTSDTRNLITVNLGVK